MEIIFLGTSSMVPTKERNQTAIFMSYKNEGILVDCGEGTQRQFKLAGRSISKITRILISHWHGDHVLGLPGLMQSLAASEYDRKLMIYGPKGSKKRFKAMFEAFVFDKPLDFQIEEVEPGIFFENSEFRIIAYSLVHGIDTLGFRFEEKDRLRIDVKKAKKLGLPDGPLLGQLQENKSITHKGKKILPKDVTYTVEGLKIGIISDTSLCDSCYKIAEGVDVLISEATYTSDLNDKAEEYNHMTAKNAGLIASQANSKKLYLIHLSARYKSTNDILEDAKSVFEESYVAQDLMKIKI
ncbi:MAG: ribonuclease Z [Nanoarchaeota archaeon]|nr:ribonuclease Z [Nanoarchaeota archaeon]MBU1704814.1 ribonuclease Z [Nanoarchaeota archaeon]